MRLKTILSIGAVLILLTTLAYAANNIIAKAGDFYVDGDVGIGTTSPQNLLHLQNSGQTAITYNDTSDAQSWQAGANVHGFYIWSNDDNAYRLVVKDGTGYVGIGTTSPDQKLTVSGSGANISLINTDINANGYQIRADHGDGTHGLGFYDTNAGLYRMVLGGGNVGIGTTSPDYELDIVKNKAGSLVDSRVYNSENANSGSGARQIVQVNGSSAGDPRFILSVRAVQEWYLGMDNNDSDKFQIGTSSVPGSETKLTIDTSGNVGIGTTSPGTYLHSVPGMAIYGATYSGISLANDGTNDKDWLIWTINDDLRFYESAASHGAGTDRVTFQAGGNVGIGTTGPQTALHVYASDVFPYGTLALQDNASGDSAIDYLAFIDGGGTNRGYVGDRSSSNDDIYLRAETGDLRLGDSSSMTAVILQGGKVGIGTTSPDHDLEIGTGTYSEIDAGESTFATGSTREIKKDITDLNTASSASRIMQLNPVSYKWDNEKLAQKYENITFDDEKTQYGLIAEDTKEVYTDMEEGRIEWHRVYVDLIATVQYLQDKNQLLESELCKKDSSYGFC